MSNFNAFTDHEGLPIKLWNKGVHVEEQALDQMRRTAALPFIHKHVAGMPDVHWGMGATVGSVIPTKGAVIPAAVGVDIGCGMNAVRLSLTAEDLPETLRPVRERIEEMVPVGFAEHTKSEPITDNKHAMRSIESRYRGILERHPALLKMGKAMDQKTLRQIGTLGGGNHFIEICLDEMGRVWIMLHSGSRGTGNAIGRYFIEKAKEDMRRWFINLPDQDLAYLPEGTKNFDDYVEAVGWAQEYARLNRQRMMELVVSALRPELPPFEITNEAINCHHNYIEKENHFGSNVYVTRKGAVRAREGDLGIIPGSMGARSYIVRGKGNPDSFHSCSHGAGRMMSRKEARKRFNVKDHCKATKGVECKKDDSVLDETPGAYKDIDSVMAAQTDLVDVVHTLKQVVCVKG